MLQKVLFGTTRRIGLFRVLPSVGRFARMEPHSGCAITRNGATANRNGPRFRFRLANGCDPATASQYAFIMYSIKNAEAINTAKCLAKNLAFAL
jgi:hypothetical protein